CHLSYPPRCSARECARAREIRDPPGQVKIAARRPLRARRWRATGSRNGRFSTEIAAIGRSEAPETAKNPAFAELSTQNRHKNPACSKMRMVKRRDNALSHRPLLAVRTAEQEGDQWPRLLSLALRPSIPPPS